MITRRALISLPLLMALPAPAHAARVFILGDSTARGAYAGGPAASYAARVAVALGAADSTLVPAGGRLETAEQAWADYGGAWDVAILAVGINDTVTPTMSDREWAARYYALVSSMRASGARVVCATPFDTGHGLEARAAIIRATPGAIIADVYAATLGRPELRAKIGAPTFYGLAADDWHPNNNGHAIIAATILSALRYTVSLPAV
jgi:hypothetical protein